jgi:hypothetical protein
MKFATPTRSAFAQCSLHVVFCRSRCAHDLPFRCFHEHLLQPGAETSVAATRFNGFQLGQNRWKVFSFIQLADTWLKPGVNEKSLDNSHESKLMTLRNIFKFRDPTKTRGLDNRASQTGGRRSHQ